MNEYLITWGKGQILRRKVLGKSPDHAAERHAYSTYPKKGIRFGVSKGCPSYEIPGYEWLNSYLVTLPDKSQHQFFVWRSTKERNG